MGFNSTIVVMNDALHQIKNDEKFGEKVYNAISAKIGREYVDISCGFHSNAATVVDCHHADGTSLIAVGGNCATVLMPYAGGYVHHTDQAKENILRAFADDLGYRIVKKSVKK